MELRCVIRNHELTIKEVSYMDPVVTRGVSHWHVQALCSSLAYTSSLFFIDMWPIRSHWSPWSPFSHRSHRSHVTFLTSPTADKRPAAARKSRVWGTTVCDTCQCTYMTFTFVFDAHMRIYSVAEPQCISWGGTLHIMRSYAAYYEEPHCISWGGKLYFPWLKCGDILKHSMWPCVMRLLSTFSAWQWVVSVTSSCKQDGMREVDLAHKQLAHRDEKLLNLRK